MTKQEASQMLIHCIKSKMSYDVYEKVDGSLGILYYHPNEKLWKIATRGSFESDQAKKATDMWHKKRINENSYNEMSWNNNYEFLLKNTHLLQDYTLCFEIIYPENRMNDGARLVTDYGTVETLILLAAIHKVTGKDLAHKDLLDIADQLELPCVVKYDYTIDQLIELQKTIPMQQEGWVVRFNNGFRIKLKGQEYCKMQKLLNSITPLNIWELMKESQEFSGRMEVSYTYKMQLPEEILPEVNALEQKLRTAYYLIKDEASKEYNMALAEAERTYPDNIEKGLGLQLSKLKHRGVIFPIYKDNLTAMNKYFIMNVRPTNNEVK